MEVEQTFIPKYWVVHDTQGDDIFIKSINKYHDRSVELFLSHYSCNLLSEPLNDDDLWVWWYEQERYVCKLMEIRLLGEGNQ